MLSQTRPPLYRQMLVPALKHAAAFLINSYRLQLSSHNRPMLSNDELAILSHFANVFAKTAL
jgi:hypothetical protein